MSVATPTRRGLLAGLAAAPIAALPFVASAEASDAAILSAWDFYRKHFDTDDDTMIERLNAAERVMLETPAMTLAGVEAKLRIAVDILTHEDWASKQALQPIGTPVHEPAVVHDYGERTLFKALQDVQRIARRA